MSFFAYVNDTRPPAMITFVITDKLSASTNTESRGGLITASTIYAGQQVVDQFGTGIDSFTMHMLIHLVGHALGLGYSGDYWWAADDAGFLANGESIQES